MDEVWRDDGRTDPEFPREGPELREPVPPEHEDLSGTELQDPVPTELHDPVPSLLQELAAPEPVEDVDEPGEPADDDDEDVPAKGGMRTSTKVVLVAAGWLLLTLFLVGRFSGGPTAERATRLDQAAAGDEGDEVAVPGEEDSDDASAADSQEIGVGEFGAGTAAYADAAVIGGTHAVTGGTGGGVYAGVPAEGSGGVGGGGALPGVAPAPGPTAGAPAADGGSTTTTAPSPGGTTDTTAPSGGGGSGTTTTTAAAPPPGAPTPAETVRISSNRNKFVYDKPNFSVPSGSVVRMVNDTAVSHTWKMATWNVSIPPGGYVDRTITATGEFGCDTHRYMAGTITVT
ncbi:MAG: hypothetical protein KY454_09730 [Actinobacteria bacterium]|nr:hypothetical protein [Actinomycetota bacterium]MBW3649830.1 hypothetical protein [Actinomycetota bacterium]